MSYIEVNDLAEAQSFKVRVKVAVVNVAATVMAEDRSGMNEARGSKRGSLARAILMAPAQYADLFVWPVVSNPTIAAAGLASPDGDLAYVVTSVFDALAGVEASEM